MIGNLVISAATTCIKGIGSSLRHLQPDMLEIGKLGCGYPFLLRQQQTISVCVEDQGPSSTDAKCLDNPQSSFRLIHAPSLNFTLSAPQDGTS